MNAPYTPSANPDNTHMITTVIVAIIDISGMVSKVVFDSLVATSIISEAINITILTIRQAVTL